MAMLNVLCLVVFAAYTFTAVSGGTTYQRWGSSSCQRDAELLYAGFMVASDVNQKGNGANSFCMPYDPEFSEASYHEGERSYLSHAEYRTYGDEQGFDIPCAVCMTYRSYQVIIPAKSSCPGGWTTEYAGHLAAPKHDWHSSNMYECLDSSMETLDGTGNLVHGSALFTYTYISCQYWGVQHQCPTYKENKRIACALCTK